MTKWFDGKSGGKGWCYWCERRQKWVKIVANKRHKIPASERFKL